MSNLQSKRFVVRKSLIGKNQIIEVTFKSGKTFTYNHDIVYELMKDKLKKMEIEIDEHQKKLMAAATKGPTCAICLEDKYAEEGPNIAVCFNKTKCKKHIFHQACVGDGRVKLCPLCRSDKKKLTKVENNKLSNLVIEPF